MSKCGICGGAIEQGICLECAADLKNAETIAEIEYYARHNSSNKAQALKKLTEAHWIKCADELPKTYEKVLVTYKKSHSKNAEAVDVDRYSYKNYKWETHGNSVVAWMPLPKPFKERDA